MSASGAQVDTGATDLGRTRRTARLSVGACALVAAPAVVLRLSGSSPSPPLAALTYGLAVVAAAFVLSWAAEAAQVDISAGLALAVLALIAVLPEYAVDFVFAANGGNAFEEFGRACRPPGSDVEPACSLALANMTGANRILIGVGWALVVLVAAVAVARRGDARGAGGAVVLERPKAVDLSFLGLATLYSLTLPLRSSLTLVDAVVLVGIFAAYAVRLARAPAEEPHLVGPAAYVGGLPARGRRARYLGMFALAAGVILMSAEPFAENLVETGLEIGVSEFVLVQWVAPFASESPELVVAVLFAWRLKSSDALGALLSSKVNQWTLLVGTLPVVFAIASGSLSGLPVDDRQREELLLTAAQSAFAVALLLRLRIDVRGAAALFGLFVAQFVLEPFVPYERVVVSVGYLLLAAVLVWRRRDVVADVVRDGLRRPYAELVAADEGRTRPPSAGS